MSHHTRPVRSDEELMEYLKREGLAARIRNLLAAPTSLIDILTVSQDYHQTKELKENILTQIGISIESIDELKRILLIAEKHPELWKGTHS